MTNDKKNVVWNIIGATTNAFNSLLFAILVTRINGIDNGGIFTYCFATACLLYMIGVYAGRTFQVTDIRNKNSDKDYIYHRILTCIIMIIVSIGFVIVKQYDIYKSSIFIILCIFKGVEAFCEAIYAILQKNGLLYKVGISMFLKAIIALIIFALINYITKKLIVSCLSIVVVNLIILFIYDLKNIKEVKLIKTKLTKETIIRLFKIGFFTFILTFLANYLINSPRYAIDDILTDNLQTIFGIIIMPATLMGLLGQYIIQPCLTKISDSIKNKKYYDLRKMIWYLTCIIFVLGVIVVGVAYFLEMPVLQIIYNVELQPYFISMIIIVIGSIFYSLSTILSAILIAMRKTVGQAILYLVIAIISTILSYILVQKYQISGASVTYFITMTIISILFFIYVMYSMKKYKKEWEKEEVKNENINNYSNI